MYDPKSRLLSIMLGGCYRNLGLAFQVSGMFLAHKIPDVTSNIEIILY